MKSKYVVSKMQHRIISKIIAIRLRQNRTRLDVAVVADINPNYYGWIERLKTGNMSSVTLEKIKQSLGVSWEEIFSPADHLLAFFKMLEKENLITNE